MFYIPLLAVFFLEFWKRRQFVLQHDWDVLGYEEAEVLILLCKSSCAMYSLYKADTDLCVLQ